MRGLCDGFSYLEVLIGFSGMANDLAAGAFAICPSVREVGGAALGCAKCSPSGPVTVIFLVTFLFGDRILIEVYADCLEQPFHGSHSAAPSDLDLG